MARSGRQDVDTLKYHENYNVAWEAASPDACLGLQYFGATKTSISQLRDDYKKNKAAYEGHIMDVFTQQPGNRGGKKLPVADSGKEKVPAKAPVKVPAPPPPDKSPPDGKDNNDKKDSTVVLKRNARLSHQSQIPPK